MLWLQRRQVSSAGRGGGGLLPTFRVRPGGEREPPPGMPGRGLCTVAHPQVSSAPTETDALTGAAADGPDG
jgi:hypothetical protein